MSAAKGSNRFTNSETALRFLTISLFSLGIFAGGIFAYQQYSSQSSTFNLPSREPQQFSINPEVVPELMSKDEAIQLAKTETKWEEINIDNYGTEAVLVHVKENGYAFFVDENTMQNTWQVAGKDPDKYYNFYIWKVKFISEEVYRNAGYERECWINAETGEVLLSAVNGGVMYER